MVVKKHVTLTSSEKKAKLSAITARTGILWMFLEDTLIIKFSVLDYIDEWPELHQQHEPQCPEAN